MGGTIENIFFMILIFSPDHEQICDFESFRTKSIFVRVTQPKIQTQKNSTEKVIFASGLGVSTGFLSI